MSFEWKLYVRNDRNERVAELEDYSEATLTPVYNDVGTWSVRLSRKSKQAADLTTPGYGIIATRDDAVMFSGIATERHHEWNGTVDQVTVSGCTDDVWLLSRLVSPSPGESTPPYTTQASDVRTGLASTVIRQYVNVNLAAGAVPARRKMDLLLAADPLIGASIRGEARWDSNLLEFIKPLAVSGGVGFRVVQAGTNLEFQVYQSTDRSSTIKFSPDLGNLLAFDYSSQAPKANYVFVGASGTGTSRIIKEFSDPTSITTWGRWEGPLVNAANTSDTTQIQQSGTDALVDGQEQASLSITPWETATMRYGFDYFLGDKVTVQLEGPAATGYSESGYIVDILREVSIVLNQQGQTVTPSVGTGDRLQIFRMFRVFRQHARRLNNLERG